MQLTTSTVIKKLLVLFLVVAGLYYAKDFLMPLAIGGVFATLFLPLCKWMEKHKVPKILAALACLLLLLAGIAGVGALLGWQIAGLMKDIDLISKKVTETGTRVQEYIFNNLGISVKEQSQILKDEQPSLTGVIQFVAGSLTALFSNAILVAVYILMLLYYRIHIKNFIIKLTSPPQRGEMEKVIYRTGKVSQQYLLGLIKMIGCLWIMYGIGFSLLGVKNAFFFAILCGLLEVVPFIGNITGTSLTVLVSAAQGAGLPVLGGIVAIYGVVQFIQGWLLEPLILGPQVKINPLFTIIALVLGGLIWGIPGVFLAIPLTAMLKIVCDHVEPLKPLGFLIGELESPKKTDDLIKKGK